jgi:hypothetical protein
MGEKYPINLAYNCDSHGIVGFFNMPQICYMGRRLYFPSEGRRAEDFFSPKNPTASARYEPANLGTRGQHGNHNTTEAALPWHLDVPIV